MHRNRAAAVVLLSLVTFACASHSQYRKVGTPLPAISVSELEKRQPIDDGSGTKTCAEQLFRGRSIEKFKTDSGEVFTIGIIELSDDGHLKDVGQRDQVFSELQKVARGGEKSTGNSPGAVVVTFVHGWHHRAKVCDENLSCYRRVIEGLVNRKDDRANKGPVFGIYIGWRGESAHKATALTFYNRKAAAHHVGALGGSDLLLQLGELQHNLDTEVRNATAGDKFVNMVTVGHSFGGALVYSAMESLSVSEYGDNKHGVGFPACPGGPKPVRHGVGDLVVLVNPAFEAARYHYFAEDLAAGQYASAQRPLLLTVASEADDAVGKAFPAGRILWLAWHPAAWGNARAQVTGLGHYPPYTTHELEFKGKAAEPDPTTYLKPDNAVIHDCGLDEEVKHDLVRATCDCSYPVYAAQAGAATAPGAPGSVTTATDGSMSVRALKNETVTLKPVHSPEHPAYIVASAPPNLITGHNDIYNPNFTMFLVGFVNSTLRGKGMPEPPPTPVSSQCP